MSIIVEQGSFFPTVGPSGCGKTTLMLVGSDLPLTVMKYGRMREGATPVLNAVSLFLMVAPAALALMLLRKAEADETSKHCSHFDGLIDDAEKCLTIGKKRLNTPIWAYAPPSTWL